MLNSETAVIAFAVAERGWLSSAANSPITSCVEKMSMEVSLPEGLIL